MIEEFSMDEFADHAKGWVEHCESLHTDPADDWEPTMFAEVDAHAMQELIAARPVGVHVMFDTTESPQPGDVGLFCMPLQGDPGQSPLADFLIHLLAQVKARRVALCLSTWQSLDPLAREKWGEIANAPDRTEQVMVLVFDRERLEIWQAPIVRSATVPPMLKGWEQMPGDAHTELTDHLKEVLT